MNAARDFDRSGEAVALNGEALPKALARDRAG
jgi:hypothetical protein